MKKTKIIATLGPATNSEKMLEKLYKAGVNIIRFNFSHANYKDSLDTIKVINELNKSGRTNIAMLLDTKGPEIRTGDLKEKNNYKKGDVFRIYVDPDKELKDLDLFCDYPYLAEDIKKGKCIIIDSGLFSVKVLEKKKNYVLVKALNSAVIGSRRHINLPGVKLNLPGITKKDKEDIKFAIENDFSYVAASFIRSGENVKEIKELLKKHGCTTLKIISKVENEEGVENLNGIIKESDGIMVARGDLGIEVPIKKLALYQKEMVDKCRVAGKMVIIATHLLETMIENPFPTRAESSDVFNSVLQQPDCLMLSGETAIGKFPIETVKMMSSIIKEAEKSIIYKHKDFDFNGFSERDLEKKILIKSGLYAGEELGAKAMIILTKTGLLARFVSSYRPNIKVFAFTNKDSSIGIMNGLFGIKPMLHIAWDSQNYTRTMELAIKQLLEKKILNKHDKIIAINDIQKDSNEIPIMEIIDLEYFG
ncbi:MAG: pyruvate kinase [Candidatus Gracilibacteria bacterium]|nr:pyruvate kinase [Candidatus Gracilibacteria bacterium]